MKLFDARTESVIACMTDALSDPLNPKFCAIFYLHVEHEPKLQTGAPRKGLHGRVGTHSLCHPMLNAIWAFLTKRMNRCHCHKAKLSPIPRPPYFFNALILLIEFMTSVLRLAPDKYWKSQGRAARAAERGTLVRWPPHACTLLGGNGDSVMTAICRWMAAFPLQKHGHKFFDLLYQVSRICGRAAVSIMFRCQQLPRSLADVLEHWLARLARDYDALVPLFITLRWWRSTVTHTDGMTTASFFGDEAERVLGIMNHMLGLIPWLARMPESMRSAEDLERWIDFGHHAAWVHSALDLPYDDARYEAKMLDSSKEVRFERSGGPGPYLEMHRYLTHLSQMDYCGMLTCKATFAGEGRRFRYCSGCKLVAYCSIECQRKHVWWRWQRDEHKLVCHDLRYLSVKLHYHPSLGHVAKGACSTTVKAACEADGVEEAPVLRHRPYSIGHKK
ncbi:hypothetical protein HDZ31DRAFT_82977 [Schizophyllum fasciatum]